jgi:hypothetical protein
MRNFKRNSTIRRESPDFPKQIDEYIMKTPSVKNVFKSEETCSKDQDELPSFTNQSFMHL